MAEFLQKVLMVAARGDRRDRFKRIFIFMVGIFKLVKNPAKAGAWFRASLGFSPAKRASVAEKFYYLGLENKNYSEYLDSAERLILYACPSKKDEICDIGCGRGFLVKSLRGKGYSKTIGVEISEYAVENKVSDFVYKKNLSEFAERQFKVVSLISVLEHIEKKALPSFVYSAARISSDYIICSIPLYPDSLADFYDDFSHRTFEREKWWDGIFEKAGFYRAYGPDERFPFLSPLVYRKIKTGFGELWDKEKRNLIKLKMGIGDNICALPALEAVKEKDPGLRLFISKESSYKEVFENNPVFQDLEAEAFPGDNIVEIHFQRDMYKSMVLDFAGQCGLSGLKNYLPKIYLSERDSFDFTLPEGKCLIIDTRSGWKTRKWPHENFEKTAEILKKKHGIRIIEAGRNFWSGGVLQTPEFLKAADFSFVDKLTLRQTAWLISKCGYLLANDSGLSHAAAAVGARSFVLYGPVEADLRLHKGLTFPVFDGECYGCYTKGIYGEPELKVKCPRGHFKCMKKILPEMVAELIAEEMDKND